MSIKTSQIDRNWILFLIISIGIHTALAGLAFSPKAVNKILPALFKRSQVHIQKPFYIDVVTLPPDAAGRKETPKKLLRLADRSITVDKESSPLPIPGKVTGSIGGATKKTQQAGATARQRPRKAKRAASGKQGRQWDLSTVGMKGKGAKGKTIAKTQTATTDINKIKNPSQSESAVVIVDWKDLKTSASKGNSSKGNSADDSGAGTGDARSLFPSQAAIAKVVRKNNAGGGRRGIYTRERSKKLHINATELKDARYLLDLKRKLDLYWNYPISAARRGEQGKLRATFKVKRDGTIYEIKLVKSSGYPTLDDAVITALRLCSPLNPLPETFEKEELDVRANFEYVLTRM